MTVFQAYQRAVELLGKNTIDYCVSVHGGWAFLGKTFQQAIYINGDGIRGLSPFLSEDKKILSEAFGKIKSGDFY